MDEIHFRNLESMYPYPYIFQSISPFACMCFMITLENSIRFVTNFRKMFLFFDGVQSLAMLVHCFWLLPHKSSKFCKEIKKLILSVGKHTWYILILLEKTYDKVNNIGPFLFTSTIKSSNFSKILIM